MRIENPEDAKGVVRKYIVGTRSTQGKSASIMIDEEAGGPDQKGAWTIKGTYVTEAGKEPFTASVTSRGEVTIIPASDKSTRKGPLKPSRR